MNASALLDGFQPHVVAVALIGARLLPIAFLCPLLGGPNVPSQVKLGVVLALSCFLHAAAGVSPGPISTTLEYGALAVRELMLGTTLGLVAALPFDTARMGGRLVDLFRGSSAEAALPFVGARESASGDVLHSLLLTVAVTGGLSTLVLASLFRSYAWVPLGTFTHTEDVAFLVVKLVGGAFATALGIGAPIAGVSLAVDTLLGLASRASSGMNLQEVGAPLRILGGGAVLWLAVGALALRLQGLVLDAPEALHDVLFISGHVP